MIDRFNLLLFHTIKSDDAFLSIFSSKFLSYDIIYKTLQIDNTAFGLKYSNFKQLLIDFNIITKHPTEQFSSYVINQRYKKLFDKIVLPEIKKRKIGVEAFKKTMEQQLIHGEEAEKFVLLYEQNRLNNKKQIDWVAEYSVDAGYDIASYNSINDDTLNRFIEVKSYEGDKPYFYWSRNEYNEARRKEDDYWVYLVNRQEINNKNYHPIKIQNPVTNVFHNTKWLKEEKVWYLKLL